MSACVSSQLSLVLPDDGASMCPFNRWRSEDAQKPTHTSDADWILPLLPFSWKMRIRQRELRKGL